VNDFEGYPDHLAPMLAYADRVAGLKMYCTGLMLPLQRKSVESLAAHLDPLHVYPSHGNCIFRKSGARMPNGAAATQCL
jgi:SRSO17 transposase